MAEVSVTLAEVSMIFGRTVMADVSLADHVSFGRSCVIWPISLGGPNIKRHRACVPLFEKKFWFVMVNSDCITCIFFMDPPLPSLSQWN